MERKNLIPYNIRWEGKFSVWSREIASSPTFVRRGRFVLEVKKSLPIQHSLEGEVSLMEQKNCFISNIRQEGKIFAWNEKISSSLTFVGWEDLHMDVKIFSSPAFIGRGRFCTWNEKSLPLQHLLEEGSFQCEEKKLLPHESGGGLRRGLPLNQIFKGRRKMSQKSSFFKQGSFTSFLLLLVED